MALAYFALGPNAERDADHYLHHYYRWLGEAADQIAASAATDPETVQGYLAAFDDAGCEELILFPCSRDSGQPRLLAEALPVAVLVG